MTEYEVKCPQTWAWYTAFVNDYNIEQKKLHIKYPNDWKQPEWMDVSSVRYKHPQSPSDSSTWHPSYNEEVECKARAEEREPYGWWPCKAKKYVEKSDSQSESELYSVAFTGWGDNHNEILGIEYIRKKSTSPSLAHMKNLFKQIYEVPRELREWVSNHCANQTILETLMPHKNISSQIIHITYLESTHKLLLIGVKRVLVTMNDILYCFFEKQKSLLRLEDRTRRLEEESKRKKEQELAAEKNTFNIHPLLSGYLRGRGGGNLDRVKRMFDGQIIRIEPQTGSCYIAAKDKQSLRLAVDQLQIVCKKVVIPKDEMGQIIGSQGKQIQDIKKKSQVIKVISWSKWPYEFETLKEIQSRRYRPYNDFRGQSTEDALETSEAIPEIISEATIDNIFEESDIIDLSKGYNNNIFSAETEEQILTDLENDALVIIGRKSRVELCVFMIEMTLNHFRQITKTRNNVRALRREINKIKGNPIPTYSNYNRRRGQNREYKRGRGQGQGQESEDQKDSSPKYGNRQRRERYQPKGQRYRDRNERYQNGNSDRKGRYNRDRSDRNDRNGRRKDRGNENEFEENNQGKGNVDEREENSATENIKAKPKRNKPRRNRRNKQRNKSDISNDTANVDVGNE